MTGARHRNVGERIETLLGEIRSMAAPPAWQRVEELVRVLLELYGAGLRRIGEVLDGAGPAGQELAGRLADDEIVSGLLILHGLHPDPVEERVRKALEQVRPYLGSHGGDVELLEVVADASAVRLRLKGSCDGCPSSVLTVRLAVEGAIRERAPEIERVEVEGLPGAAEASRTDASGEWISLPAARHVKSGTLDVEDVGGTRLVLCRIEGKLYAYHDGCPACGAGFEGASLEGAVLVCPACHGLYHVRHAGRAVGDGDRHLVPVPLLEDAAGPRVVLAEGRP